jgi:AAA-like domain
MQRANPYNYNLPVESAMFFGRHSDVAALATKLTTMPGDSIALVGGRRMGKTSMLEALRRTLEAAGAEEPNQLLVLIFLDLSGEGIDSAQDFFRIMYDEVQGELGHLLALPPPNTSNWSDGPITATLFRRQLEAWGRATLEQRSQRLRIILLLDECEEIVEQPWAVDLHTTLRALLVGPSTRNLLKVVMAGSHRFLTQVRQRGSPLWNILVYHMLRVFDESATRELLMEPSQHGFADDVMQAIIEQSGGQPFLTQYLAHHLWNRGLEHLNNDTVQQIADAFHHERNDFADWTGGFGAAGLRIYEALMGHHEPLAERDVQALLSPPPPNLAQALDALCYHGVARRVADGAQYQIVGLMFRTWFIATNLQASPIEEADRPDDVLRIKQRRLEVLEQQQAIQGIATPPHIVLEIQDLQREIDYLKQGLSRT